MNAEHENPSADDSDKDHWGKLLSKIGAKVSAAVSPGKSEEKITAKLPGITPAKAKEKMPQAPRGDWSSLASQLGVAATAPPMPPVRNSDDAGRAGIAETKEADQPGVRSAVDAETLAAEIAAREAELAELADIDFLEEQEQFGNGDDAVATGGTVEVIESEEGPWIDSEGAAVDSDEGSGKPRRRRRRGRRRRGREKTSDRQPAEAERGGEMGGDEEPASAESPAIAGEGEDVEDEGDSPKRVRRRRRRRGRKPPVSRDQVDESHAEQDAADDDEDDEELAFAVPAEEDDEEGNEEMSDASGDGERTVHRNIPTWLDAVGVIVDRNLEQREKSGRGGGGGGGANRRGGASNQRRGGRRRRGGGRN